MTTELQKLGALSKAAERTLRIQKDEYKTEALQMIAKALIDNADYILAENQKDIEEAKNNQMTPSMIDRLSLNHERIESMAEGVIAVSKWPDPIGKILNETKLPNGINMKKVSVPIGVIGIIFEARPNVTSDCAALCIKSGNTVILRGGKEAFNSNLAISEVMRSALSKSKISPDCIQLVKDTTRQSATDMMTLTEYLDVLIPRGGAGLIRSVVENAKVPVIETGSGNCHIYVDKTADINMAAEIIFNAKTSRPSVCNSAEKVLIHKNIAATALPIIADKLHEKSVTLRGDLKSREVVSSMEVATDEDWGKEYLDYIMGIKVVDSLDEAIAHIEKYSTHHSECIITSDNEAANKFLASVDSAAVYHNVSTRFTDGGEMGLGAEIGISTQKLHARGPMGVDQLVSYKYTMTGNGQIR